MSDINLGLLTGPVLIFGGPYSNLAATVAIKAQAHALGIPPERTICTGDLVAYCADPVKTVELIRDWGIPVVKGNCEESLANDSDDCGCGFDEGSACSVLAVTWFEYASRLINKDQRRWMNDLPASIRFQYAGLDCLVIHAGVSNNNQFVFESDSLVEKSAQIRQAQADVIISGHSGIPFGQKVEAGYWLNAGVIGMPANNGSADVWYMLLESDSPGVLASWHQLSYPFKESQQSTRAAGMVEYAQALESGIWPSQEVLPDWEKRQRGRRISVGPLMLRGP
jgi:predicted phosphodiesterase